MKYITKYIIYLLLWLPAAVSAQQAPVLTLDSIIQRVDRNNVLLQSYGLKAESYKYSADAATAWMAPMVGVGTYMTPYPGQTVMEDRDKGSLMLQLEQDIPNPAKLNAKKRYIASQGNIELATRDITLNDFKARAKLLYYNWLIAKQRITVLQETEKIMQTMKKIEEVRYPYNQSQLSGVYRANAKIEDNRNMIRMKEGTIAKARSWLNSLMNAPGNQSFEIDTTYEPRFMQAASYDTSSLSGVRKDIVRMDASIQSMQLNIESMKHEKKPDFRIRFDHMSPLGEMMPKSYSVMGMVSIPIAPWASKMYKSGVKAMQYNVQAMEKERSAMLQETQGMLYGMQYEIQTMQQRIATMEGKVIPALQQTLDANFLNYQENKLALSNVIDSWEALAMMQSSVLDEKLKLYEMIVDYEKQLYR
ncbi:TolC family protein [Chitinophaga filiformis]|uniref:Outer membrane protein TolC n=1 Tax=Chitinophaga filiformis TaxID=104663 RepID=A0A1G7M5C7_CHIFI|nr:TolC family protein [Chitinophaga filiformis]SDF56420.1 Outer membrane protein TolC [Chitinophaga filiformis]